MNYTAVLFYVFIATFVATAAITLLGLIKTIDIEEQYLGRLFKILVVEVVGAIIVLFGAVDFFGVRAEEFIATLPTTVQADTAEEARRKVQALVDEALEFEEQLTVLRKEVAGKTAELLKYADVEGSALLLFAQLNSDIMRRVGPFP